MGSLTGIAVGVKHNRVIVARERICRIIVNYDGHGSCVSSNLGGEAHSHGIMDDVGVAVRIAGNIRNRSDDAEIDSVAKLEGNVAGGAPLAGVVVLNLFFQRRLFALGRGSHIGHNLHQIGGIEVICTGQSVILVLDEVVACRQTGDHIVAGTVLRAAIGVDIREEGGNFFGKGPCLLDGCQQFCCCSGRDGESLCKALCVGVNAGAPDDVGENFGGVSAFVGCRSVKVALENLIGLKGVVGDGSAAIDSDGVGRVRGQRCDAQGEHDHQNQQK